MNTLEMNQKVAAENIQKIKRWVNIKTEKYSKWKKVPLDGSLAERNEKSVYLKVIQQRIFSLNKREEKILKN